jgi:hypothetical protein
MMKPMRYNYEKIQGLDRADFESRYICRVSNVCIQRSCELHVLSLKSTTGLTSHVFLAYVILWINKASLELHCMYSTHSAVCPTDQASNVQSEVEKWVAVDHANLLSMPHPLPVLRSYIDNCIIIFRSLLSVGNWHFTLHVCGACCGSPQLW